MIAIPFIVFGSLFVWTWRRQGFFSIGTYIMLLYTIISLMSIFLDANNFYAHSCKKLQIELFPPLLYCFLLIVCFYPYITKKLPRISPYVSPGSGRWLDVMTYGYFAIFCIILYVSLTRIEDVVLSNSLAEIRNEQYTGETVSFYDHLLGFPRYLCAACSILAPSGYVMTLIFLFNVAFRKKSVLFHIMTLCGSLSQLLIAINIADRSNFAYWILLMGLGICILFPYFSRKAKVGTVVLLSCLVSVILVYFMAVTISRFDDRSGGTIGGIVTYSGQSYINFCNFISYVQPEDSLCEIFPLTTRLAGGESYFEVASKVRSTYNLNISVFSTFLGYIYSISGGLVMTLFVLFYNRVSSFVLNHRKQLLELGDLVRIWAASLVLVLGLFSYFFSFAYCTIALIIWIFLSYRLNPNRRTRRKHVGAFMRSKAVCRV